MTNYRNLYRTIDGIQQDIEARLTKLREQIRKEELHGVSKRQRHITDAPVDVESGWREYALNRWTTYDDFKAYAITVSADTLCAIYRTYAFEDLKAKEIMNLTKSIYPVVEVL